MDITRERNTVTVTIVNGKALSNAFDFSYLTMGVLHMPSAWTAASIGFKVSSESGGTFQPLYDQDGGLVQISSPAAGKAYALPAELAGAMYVKLWSQNGSGTDTNQGAERSIVLDLKS